MNAVRSLLSHVLVLLLALGSPPIAPGQESQQPAGGIRIVIVEGDGAINNVRQRVAREPIVQVEDENRKPVAGAAVTFLLPNQGPGVTFPNGARTLTVTTDNQGQAVARGLRPNNVNGEYQIRVNASHRGRTANTTINQSNAFAAAAAAGAISGKLLAIILVAGAAVAGGAVAATRNGNGNGGGGGTPTIITPGSPSVGGPQ